MSKGKGYPITISRFKFREVCGDFWCVKLLSSFCVVGLVLDGVLVSFSRNRWSQMYIHHFCDFVEISGGSRLSSPLGVKNVYFPETVFPILLFPTLMVGLLLNSNSFNLGTEDSLTFFPEPFTHPLSWNDRTPLNTS